MNVIVFGTESITQRIWDVRMLMLWYVDVRTAIIWYFHTWDNRNVFSKIRSTSRWIIDSCPRILQLSFYISSFEHVELNPRYQERSAQYFKHVTDTKNMILWNGRHLHTLVLSHCLTYTMNRREVLTTHVWVVHDTYMSRDLKIQNATCNVFQFCNRFMCWHLRCLML